MHLFFQYLRLLFVDQFAFPKKANYLQSISDITRQLIVAKQNNQWTVWVPFHTSDLIILINCVHFIYMATFDLNPICVFTHFDIIRIVQLPPSFYWVLTVTFPHILYLFHNGFFKKNTNFNTLNDILKNDDWKLFLWSNKFHNKLATNYMQERMLLVINISTLFVYCIGMFATFKSALIFLD